MLQDLLLGMQLACAAEQPWAVLNGALAAWNAFLPMLHRQRHAELAGVLLPLLKQLLKVGIGPGCSFIRLAGTAGQHACVHSAAAATMNAFQMRLLTVMGFCECRSQASWTPTCV